MALPQTQCCRAIRRRLRSPCDSSLLPESTLASALEQLCSISRVTSRRNGSNVPGPLENRRRTGKRHMGELNFGHLNAPAPFWELANSVDLTQWKWTPPSSFETRHAQQQERGDSRSFLASLQSWVSQSQTPSTRYADGLETFLPSMTPMEAATSVSSPDAVRIVERAATPTPRELASESLNGTFDSEWLKEKALNAMFSEQLGDETLVVFCNGLYTATAEETIDCATLASFLERVTDVAYDMAAGSNGAITTKRCSSLLLRLYTAVNDGLFTASNARNGHFDDYHEAYATLLVATSRLKINSLILFGKIMANIPAESWYNCRHAIVKNIDGFLDALSRHATSEEEKGKPISRQIAKMAGCLGGLNPELSQHRWILQRISQRLSTNLEAASDGHQVSRHCFRRIAWLQLLARLPQVEDNHLVEVCNMLESSSSTGLLTQRQICELFLTRINSRYSVKHISIVCRQLKSSSESACYASVSSSLWKTGQHRYLKMLANLLERLGRQQDIRHVAHGLRKHVHNEIQPLANLAIGLGHPQLAVWVYFRYHQSRWKSKTFWNTNFAQEILHKLMESKEMSTESMLDALKINPTRPRQSTKESWEDVTAGQDLSDLPAKQQRLRPRLTLQRIRQTEKIATALASTRHISDREALRRITRCIKFLQSHNTPISAPILHALFDVVTRDLEAGKPGRTSRLKWFLGLLLKETDANNVLAVGLALKKWRQQLE
ncbi:hypothetical protein E8E14_012368 [Neopestalotiopsis sp. 37M]|nr:hypothetical protein E8E14_012368 [Neopestalotiopsis sp. 37M]